MKYNVSINDILERTCHLYADKNYLFDGETYFTYKQLHEEVVYLSGGLRKLGIRKGDKVIVCLPNWHEFVVVFFGLARIGAIIIPCNPCYRTEDLIPIVENSQTKATFISNDNGKVGFFESQGIKNIFTVRFRESNYYSYDDLLSIGQNNHEYPLVQIDPENDLMAILYTSGTTGRPKGSMLTHKNLYYSASTTRTFLQCDHLDVIFTPVPVYHVFGLVPGVILGVLTGAEIIFMEKFKAVNALQLIERGKATIHLGVPTMYILELNKLEERFYDVSSLRTGVIAGAPTPSGLLKEIYKKMHCKILSSYGLTETSSAVTFTSFSDDEHIWSNTVGKTVEGTEVKIIGENGRVVPDGEIGELVCKGEGVMKGYYRMPLRTREVMDENGWFYTGDLAKVDEHGYITIVGRKKDMIVRGGFKIYPREVEDILYRHPSILEAVIVGYPNPVLGENSCAFIKLKENHHESEEKLKKYLAERVVKYKVPDKIIFVEDFPYTQSGKINKEVLRNMLKYEKLRDSC